MGQLLRPWKTILQIEIGSGEAVYRQIAEGIKQEIKRGRLKPGTPIPGSRQLAVDLNVNRKTIVLAYEELMAEGWLVSSYKTGTFVSQKLPEKMKRFYDKKQPAVISNFSFRKSEWRGDPFVEKTKNSIVFDDGLPDVRLAPMNEFAREYRRIFQQSTRWRMMGYGNPRGSDQIRNAMADMLLHDRGLDADTDRLCITRGSQMALYLTAKTLIEKGDVIAVEDPGYSPAWNTFVQCGARLLPVKVDQEGICVDTLEKLCLKKKIKAVYVTPHHQFPTTVSMKIDRRLKLIDLSNTFGFAIIEDDYDHEFHFESKSLLPLASLPNAANVIYIGSLSKLMAPAVRIGYILAPAIFIESVAALRKIIDIQGDTVMEHAVAELMNQGIFKKHVRRAYRTYSERRDHMENMLHKYLGDRVDFIKPPGGLAFWVRLKHSGDTQLLATSALKKRLSVIPTESFSFNAKPLNALRLGYASLTTSELEQGVSILAKLIHQ